MDTSNHFFLKPLSLNQHSKLGLLAERRGKADQRFSFACIDTYTHTHIHTHTHAHTYTHKKRICTIWTPCSHFIICPDLRAVSQQIHPQQRTVLGCACKCVCLCLCVCVYMCVNESNYESNKSKLLIVWNMLLVCRIPNKKPSKPTTPPA